MPGILSNKGDIHMHDPIDGPIRIRGKGWNRLHNVLGKNIRTNPDGSLRNHQGWDILSLPGSPVYAVANGTICNVKNAGDYGRQFCLAFEFNGKTYWAFY